MVFALYTLMEKYKNKKLYIWNVNRDSIGIFTKAFLSRIRIQGFVSDEETEKNDTYMNCPVIFKEEVSKDSDAIVLLADEVSEDVKTILPDGQAVYWSDSLEIHHDLRKSRVIVYGTGGGAARLNQIFDRENIKPECYCVTNQNHAAYYAGKKVIDAGQLGNYQGCSVIVSVWNRQYHSEILDTLNNFTGAIYIDTDYLQDSFSMINFIQSIEYAVKKNRKIYLYGKRDMIAELIEESLSSYHICIDGYVYSEKNEADAIESIYALALEGVKDKLIIINERLPEHMVRARENVELSGFSLEDFSYTGFQYYTYSNAWMLSKVRMIHDSLVGDSMLYSASEAGWKLYGTDTDTEGKVRILVLGGSTSSEAFYPENWVSRLYDQLRLKGIDAVIYNGAHCGDDIVDEILRLLRDGYVLRPQIVISMSGVNNLRYKPGCNQFNEERIIGWIKAFSPDKTLNEEYFSGICCEESLYSFWSRNIKLLNIITEFYGGKFFGFLQPMNMTMNDMSLWEKSLYEQDGHRAAATEFSNLAKDGEGYINLMRLFEHQDGMFFDVCHYTGKAQEILADKVLETIASAI